MVGGLMRLPRGCLIALLLAGTSGVAAERVKIVVLEVAVNDSSPDEADRKRVEQLAAAINEQILTELSQAGRFVVVGKSDIAAMLGLERQKQLLGCTEDSNECLAELSGALGAPYMISGALARAGGKLRLDLKLLGTAKGEVLARQGETLAGEDEVFTVVAKMVRALATAPALGGEPPRPSRAPQAVLMGLGAAAAVTGAVLLAVQFSQTDVLNARIGAFFIDEAEQRRDSIYQLRTIGSGLLIGGLVVAAGSTAWFLVSGSKAPALSVVPLRDGAFVSWSTQW